VNAANREMLHDYADLVAAGVPARAAVSGHRRAPCARGPCGEDFEALLAAVRDAAD